MKPGVLTHPSWVADTGGLAVQESSLVTLKFQGSLGPHETIPQTKTKKAQLRTWIPEPSYLGSSLIWPFAYCVTFLGGYFTLLLYTFDLEQ